MVAPTPSSGKNNMSKLVDLTFVGQVDSISPDEEDLYVSIRVTDYTSVKGSFSRNAESDDDYYGYRELDWEIMPSRSGYGEEFHGLTRKQADEIAEKYEGQIIDQIIEYMES